MLLALYSVWGDFGPGDTTPPGISFAVYARIIIATFVILQLLGLTIGSGTV